MTQPTISSNVVEAASTDKNMKQELKLNGGAHNYNFGECHSGITEGWGEGGDVSNEGKDFMGDNDVDDFGANSNAKARV